MSSKLKKYWEKTETLRQSMPEIINPEFIKEFQDFEEGETYYSKINKILNSYKEINYICKKTKIKPFYYLILLIVSLCFIVVGYFGKHLTIILATLYPLFMTFKSLNNYDDEDEQNRIKVIHWLKYWVFYCVFLNFEGLFGNLFQRFYFIFKIVILLHCFPINSKLTEWIYNNCLGIVKKYGTIIEDFFKNVYEHLTESKKELEEKRKKKRKKNDDDDEDENLGNMLKEKGGKAAMDLLKNLY